MSEPILSVRSVILHVPATAFVQLIRAKPLVMVVFWFFIPIAFGVASPQYWVARIAGVGYEAAYLGETIRAGIQPVPRGRLEAASATGLRYGRTTHLGRLARGHWQHAAIPGHAVHHPVQGHLARRDHRLHGLDQGRPGGEPARDPAVPASCRWSTGCVPTGCRVRAGASSGGGPQSRGP